MTCYCPLDGWLAKQRNPETGRRPVVFKMADALLDRPIKIPCGKCIGCKLDKSRTWAIRMSHEAASHQQNAFITLTYSDEHLPEDLSLNLDDIQKFFKRYRKSIEPNKIRIFYCGEYGELNARPHYHAIIFGHDFDDQVYFKSNNDNKIYISEKLDNLWGKGFSSIGKFDYASAGYVARYSLKKLTGNIASAHYNGRRPEFANMSSRPKAIGQEWIEKYYREIYPDDFIIFNGQKIQPPAYYDKCLETLDPELYRKVKANRARHQYKQLKSTRHQPRIQDQQTVKQAQAGNLKRNL